MNTSTGAEKQKADEENTLIRSVLINNLALYSDQDRAAIVARFDMYKAGREILEFIDSHEEEEFHRKVDDLYDEYFAEYRREKVTH